jgi:hypothetical protein
MTVTPKVLIDPFQAPAAAATAYTSPTAGKGTIIDKFTGTNTTGAAVTVTVYLVKLAGAAGPTNMVVSVKSIAANATDTFPELVGHVLNPGDFVSLFASAAASITIRSSGRELT